MSAAKKMQKKSDSFSRPPVIDIKSASSFYDEIRPLSAATILGDGKVVLISDISKL